MNVGTPLSIIVPTLNEADSIAAQLGALAPLRARGAEIIVADGGSTDGTAALAQPHADRVIHAPRGRALQMNAGAGVAHGACLLFLHADTRLPPDADGHVEAALSGGHAWGRFDVAIDGEHVLLPLIARLMNLRSRLTGIATGDQAIFVTREAFLARSGFPDIPLMEDIVFTTGMRQKSPPACLKETVTTSGRRWEKHGLLPTILMMWWLRLRFYFGASPNDLAKEYGYVPHES